LPLIEPKSCDRIRPLRGRMMLQVIAGVLDKQRLDVGDVLSDLLIIRPGPSATKARAMMLTKRQANSLKAALLPSEGSWLAIRVATSVIRANSPTAL